MKKFILLLCVACCFVGTAFGGWRPASTILEEMLTQSKDIEAIFKKIKSYNEFGFQAGPKTPGTHLTAMGKHEDSVMLRFNSGLLDYRFFGENPGRGSTDIYLVFLDEDYFQIDEIYLGRAAAGWEGTKLGHITMDTTIFNKIKRYDVKYYEAKE